MDIGTSIDKAIANGRLKSAILIAIEHGWFGLAPILATIHERKLSDEDRIAIVCAFHRADETDVAIELGHRWHISRRIPRGLNDRFDNVVMARNRPQ